MNPAQATPVVPLLLCLITGAALGTDRAAPQFGQAVVTFGERAAPAASLPASGFSLIAAEDGPQLAVTAHPTTLLADVRPGEAIQVDVSIEQISGPFEISADVRLVEGSEAEVCTSASGVPRCHAILLKGRSLLQLAGEAGEQGARVQLLTRAVAEGAAVRWSAIYLKRNGRRFELPIVPPVHQLGLDPPPVSPPMHSSVEAALIEWDWRMQDGIGTQREPRTYPQAVQTTLERGQKLIENLKTAEVPLGILPELWKGLRGRWRQLSSSVSADHAAWESLWREVHQLRRQIALANPLAQVGPLLFVKQVPGAFSHQLTQYYGADAKPGGGIFVLDNPGESMQCRQLAAGKVPTGSYQHPEVSFDGRRILFSYCRVEKAPTEYHVHGEHRYHLYEMSSDGTGLRQLTDGPYDDFSPRYLPDGRVLFISTRRGGFHRCGRGPCPVYTLAIAEADGSNPHPISYHETHEWDPAILDDGRVIYTRWDYVDRHAVHYQQLWSVRPDGTDVRIFYGNNTWNPVGVWEARPVPGSHRVMATAGAHHAMTAGSIILLDVTWGLDGLDPITRLTPDALFPESEAPVVRQPGGQWHAPVGVKGPLVVPPEAARWPGHCYRSPYPLSEDYFLAAYSFDSLIGEPTANRPNMFGIYLVDRFGNKELLYRDLNIASLWPVPLGPRPMPKAVPSSLEETHHPEGTFFLQNVYQSWPKLPDEPIARLRIVQVLPKSTPHINDPYVGIPPASPGKQVLGTVPVEPDGSAYFRAPAGISLAFQALDPHGRAVQIMRSITYLQPGETSSCIGCHQPRTSAPGEHGIPMALRRDPSAITPGPEGSKPFSYPRLVQPVLQRHCVRCHNHQRSDGGVVLTGEPQGHYTVSYNALAPMVPYSAWPRRDGDFRVVNSEPRTRPGHFGARGSRLMDMLLEGHEGVELPADDIERLATWMDANVLFYGTFNPKDQARQQRGELIAGPGVE